MVTKKNAPPPIKGHALLREGRAYDSTGRPIFREAWDEASNGGYGKCECGALSEHLETTAARRLWHKRHKSDLLKHQQSLAKRRERDRRRRAAKAAAATAATTGTP